MRAVLVLPVLLAAATPGRSGEPPDPTQVVEERCGACHETRPGRASGFLSRRRSLQEMADDPAVTAGGLRAFLSKPHVRSLRLSPAEVEAVVLYVEGLR